MTQPPALIQRDRDTQDPWERYGWIMGAIWLVFLMFPLTSAFTVETSWVWRSFAIAAILTFAAVYVYGFVRIGRTETWARVNRFGWRCLAVLVSLTLATAFVIGLDALGMVTFLIAFAMFSLPLGAALGIGVVGVAGAVLVPLAMGVLGETWFLIPILLLVGVATAVVRVLDQRGMEHQQIAGEMALVAERERVARDVHDVLGHSLTVVTIKAELAQRLVDADPERAKAELAQIQSLTRESLAEIRATVAGLRVARLGDELTSAGAALADAGVSGQLPADPSVVDPRPPESVHARDSAASAVVLPDPAGASASCTRAPLPASWRTSWAWPGLRSTPLAADSSTAHSTTEAAAREPSVHPAAPTSSASASMTAWEV